MKITQEELDQVVYQNPDSNKITHNVSDMFKFSQWVSDRFDSCWNKPKTYLLFFDKVSKSHGLTIEDLYLVWYTKYR